MKNTAQSLFATLATLAFIGPAAAQKEMTLRTLVDDPRAAIGTDIRVKDISCVDPGGAGFVCVGKVGGQTVRVTADFLGAATPLPIANLLIGDCKGTANLGRRQCRFEIVLKPLRADRTMVELPEGNAPVLAVHSLQIDMFPIRR